MPGGNEACARMQHHCPGPSPYTNALTFDRFAEKCPELTGQSPPCGACRINELYGQAFAPLRAAERNLRTNHGLTVGHPNALPVFVSTGKPASLHLVGPTRLLASWNCQYNQLVSRLTAVHLADHASLGCRNFWHLSAAVPAEPRLA